MCGITRQAGLIWDWPQVPRDTTPGMSMVVCLSCLNHTRLIVQLGLQGGIHL